MAGVYCPRHPEWTVLYRVLFHYFDKFLAEYESRFEKEYDFFRSIVKSDHAAICHLLQWDEAKLARERSFSQRGRK